MTHIVLLMEEQNGVSELWKNEVTVRDDQDLRLRN